MISDLYRSWYTSWSHIETKSRHTENALSDKMIKPRTGVMAERDEYSTSWDDRSNRAAGTQHEGGAGEFMWGPPGIQILALSGETKPLRPVQPCNVIYE